MHFVRLKSKNCLITSKMVDYSKWKNIEVSNLFTPSAPPHSVLNLTHSSLDFYLCSNFVFLFTDFRRWRWCKLNLFFSAVRKDLVPFIFVLYRANPVNFFINLNDFPFYKLQTHPNIDTPSLFRYVIFSTLRLNY